MLDEKYLELIKLIKEMKSKIEEDYKNAPGEGFENLQAFRIADYLKDELEEAIYDLEMLTRTTLEGSLVLNSQGRFNLDTAENLYFTCGSPIEMFIEGEWHNGLVEHNGESYYFYCYDKDDTVIEEGMKARIRVDKK